jgi:hypothetical protein
VEVELAKTKKELAMIRIERDILKKQPRILPRSRCPVRADRKLCDPTYPVLLLA